MSFHQMVPTAILINIFFSLLVGVFVLVFGRRLTTIRSWLIGLCLSVFLILSCLGWFSLSSVDFQNMFWSWKWIGSKLDSESIRVGVVQDPLGLTVMGLSSVIGFVFLINQNLLPDEPRIERILASVLFNVAGVALAWNALTLWFMLIGIALAIFGGFIALGSRWSEDDCEADFASRYALEHTLGLMVAIVGGCVLVAAGADLSWNVLNAWATSGEVRTGLFLLLGGLFIQFRPFPFLGWAGMPSRSSAMTRVLLTQVFLGWAAFSVILRFSSLIGGADFFEIFGWIALVSAILTIGTGFFLEEWSTSLYVWLSAAFCVCICAVSVSRAEAGILLAICFGIGAYVLAFCGTVLLGAIHKDKEKENKTKWIKGIAVVAALINSGAIGFGSCSGIARWLWTYEDKFVELISAVAVFFFLVLLIWKVFSSVIVTRKTIAIGWAPILSVVLLLGFSLGFLWTGRISGSDFFSGGDQIFLSLMDSFFIQVGQVFTYPGESLFLYSAFWLYWGALMLGLIGALWADKYFSRLQKAIPRISRFLAEGYWIDALVRFIWIRVIGSGKKIDRYLYVAIWDWFIPVLVDRPLRGISLRIFRLDLVISGRLDLGVRRSVGLIAKVIQLIQNGNLQWYLLFVVGAGITIILKYLMETQ